MVFVKLTTILNVSLILTVPGVMMSNAVSILFTVYVVCAAGLLYVTSLSPPYSAMTT